MIRQTAKPMIVINRTPEDRQRTVFLKDACDAYEAERTLRKDL